MTTPLDSTNGNQSLEDRLGALAVLAEPLRRRLYFLVADSAAPVSRDDAARMAGIARPLAAFHLDRLVEAGLLVADFQRPPGRTGPGAGRPAKRYRRSALDLAVSVPERRYGLAAELFAAGLDRDRPSGGTDAVDAAARGHGSTLGRMARRKAGPRPARRALVSAAVETLAGEGFEPSVVAASRSEPAHLELRNCPFDALAKHHRDLTCGMNYAMLAGFVDELGLAGTTARLDPEPNRCCVVVELPRDVGMAGER